MEQYGGGVVMILSGIGVTAVGYWAGYTAYHDAWTAFGWGVASFFFLGAWMMLYGVALLIGETDVLDRHRRR